MGVQGLKAQLELYYSPDVVTLASSEGGDTQILLVDAAAVKLTLYTRLKLLSGAADGDIKAEDAAFLQDFYNTTAVYFQALLRTGLKVVCVLEGALPVGIEEAVLQRRKREVEHQSALLANEVTMAFNQALLDLEIHCERALHATDTLLLAYYLAHSAKVFTLLTNDTDFLIYGVEKVAFVNDLTVDAQSTTFQIWHTSAAWLTWRKNRMTKGVSPVSIMCRAQIAALLGSEVNEAVRNKPWAGVSVVPSPLTAAELLIASPVDDPFSLKMFQVDLGIKSFSEADLHSLNTVVEGFLTAYKGASHDMAALRAGPSTLPHLHTVVATRVAELNLPALFVELACRGVADFPAAAPADWDTLGAERTAAAAAMLSTPRALYLRDVQSNGLLPLVQGDAPDGWFDPTKVTWTETPPTVKPLVAPSGAAVKCGATVTDTVVALQKAYPAAAARMALLHALWAHAATPDAALDAASIREALLPGVPRKTADEAPPTPPPPDAVSAALAEAAAGVGLSVDTGSSLSTSDWLDIDSKDLVARAKATMAFKIMREIQPWQGGEGEGGSQLNHDIAFKFMYLNRKDDMYKKMAKSCYPDEYAAYKDDKELSKSMKAVTKDGLIEELKKAKDKHTIQWMEALGSLKVLEILFLRREAIKAGPGSVEWNAARVVWSYVGDRVKDECFEIMHTNINRTGKSGPPRRYKHQQELMELVGSHLSEVASAPDTTLPLQVILATPTGSGKTFTAVMMHLYLLKKEHPDAVLLYSVPTKQVLKRVGQECEAHGVVYWTAARDGNLHQVRRPYSIRFAVRKKREQAQALANPEKAALVTEAKKSAGSGTIEQQMFKAMDNGKLLQDRGLGKPDVVVADVYTTAALLEASRRHAGSFFGPDKLVLYFDEPNMGIQLEPAVSVVVHRIMLNTPKTAILASATMPNWDSLPAWWKGEGTPAKRTTIPLEPYDLPMCQLAVLDERKRKVQPISLLGLFKSHAEYSKVMKQQGMRRIVMLRYLQARQANMLLASASEGTKEDGDAHKEAKKRDWMALYGDVRTLRQSLEPALLSLTPSRFAELQADWRDKEKDAPTNAEGVAAAISTTGVTMIATLNARQAALAMASQMKGGLDVHELRRRVREAERTSKAAEKEAARKKDDDDAPQDAADMGGAKAGMLDLRSGLSVSLQDAEECDDETLVMLSKGVAYTLATGTEPLVKKLYMQALLHVPDHVGGKARALPPIHVLVVDYSSIYGTDCPAVDTIIMDESLGPHLSWEDHQQFLGRLRRDGTAVFLSKHTMRMALLGRELAGPEEDLPEVKLAHNARMLCLNAHLADISLACDGLLKLELPSGCTYAEVGRAVLKTILELTFPCPDELKGTPLTPLFPATAAVEPKELAAVLQMLKMRLTTFGPVLTKGLKSGREQFNALQDFHRLCTRKGLFNAHANAGARYVAAVLKLLYDEDVFGEPAILTWAAETAKEEPTPDKFMAAAQPFVTWLEEADSEEDSD